MTEKVIYLDYNATTPVDERVLEAMLPYFVQKFGNAASATHPYGWEAAKAVDAAREILAAGLNCTPQEVIFTSGATEAINLAIRGVARMYASKGNHFIAAQTEHKATLDTLLDLEKDGARITWLPVDREGLISLTELAAAITPQTVLVAIMLANNETGVIQDIPAIAEVVHAHNSILLSDVVQAAGKIAVNVQELGIDLAPISAHKFYGPKGVGALYVRRRGPRVVLSPEITGGGHERGLRSGTLNVPGIVGMGAAWQLAQTMMEAENTRLGALRDYLERSLVDGWGASVNSGQAPRLAHVANLAFPNFHARDSIRKLSSLAVATGSACTSAQTTPSHVLTAMGLPVSEINGSLRFSLGRFTTAEEIEWAIEKIKAGVCTE